MSEKFSASPEKQHASPEIAPPAPERPRETPEKIEHERQPDELAAIQKSIEQHARPAAELEPAERQPAPASQLFVNQQLKKQSLDRSLTRVRKQLSTPEKLLSRVTHQPVIDKLSDLGGQTVARPSGLLGGGLLALLGGAFILYLAKHYGFEYNFLAFSALFLAGYLLGLLAELAVKLARARR